MKLLIFFFFIVSSASIAAEDTHVHYVLKDLKPLRVSQYRSPGSRNVREYLQFQNEIGTHYLIYDENSAAPPVAALKKLRDKAGKKNVSCKLDLDCTTNAFCTGSCKNLYYEITNLPPDTSRISQNHCSVHELECGNSIAEGKR